MGLRDWVRRHGNVFSFSTREVVGDAGSEAMLEEEYGERAVEAERAPAYGIKSGPGASGTVVQLDPSYDEIADGDEPPPEPAT